jgi:hypothetical protein
MRTLGFRTHILLVLAGAAGVVASLGRPWYGPAPAPLPDNTDDFDVHGPLQELLDAMRRWVTEAGGTTGWHALGASGAVIAGLSVAAALCALGCLLPPVQTLVNVPLRYLSFAAFGVTLWRVLDSPGPNSELELRLGALVALVGATMVWVSAQSVASAPMRRRPAPSFASSS